jgi:CHAT domain-containing protein/Flp pilus assembly protein TadD
MRLKRFFWIAPTTVLLIVSQTFQLSFPLPFAASPVVAQTSNVRKAEADRLFQQGLQQGQTRQIHAAIQSFQQALAIYREIGDRKEEAITLAFLGGAYDLQRDLPRAIEFYQQSLAIAREIGEREEEGKLLVSLGLAYVSLGDYTQGIEYTEQGLAIAREINDPELEALAMKVLSLAQTQNDPRKAEGEQLLRQGLQQFQLGQFEAALQSFQKVLNICQETKIRECEAAVLGNLGIIYRNLGDYAKAIEYHEQELAIAREIKDRQGETAALASLGNTYLNLGDYRTAIEYHAQNLAIVREIKDRQGEAAALNNLGIVYRNLGDYAKAIKYLEQSLAVAKEIKNLRGEGNALANLGNTYLNLGDYTKTIEYHEQSLAIAREVQDRQGEAAALANLGIAYLKLGEYTQGIEHQQQSLVIARDLKNREYEGRALGNLSGAYLILGDYTKAIEYSMQYLAIAREIKNRPIEAKALGNLGAAYLNLENYTKAIEYSEQLLAIAQEIKDAESQGAALNNLGYTLYKSGNLALAEKTLIEAMKVKESLRYGLDDTNKVSIFDTQYNTYLNLQEVLIAQNKTDSALEISERGRARAFVELLASGLSTTGNSETIPLQSLTIEQIKQIAKAQNATLVQYSIISNVFKVEGKRQSKGSELYIWIISPNGKVTFRQVDLKSLGETKEGSLLRQLVTETLESLGVGEERNGIFEVSVTNPSADPQHQIKSLKQLHQLLIQPIADLLPSDPEERVIFIPHQDLFRVPFPALMDSDGKYLVEKHTILSAPSIQVLDLTYKQRQHGSRSGQGALVVGNPSPMPSGFQPLLGAEKEALEVAQLLRTQALIGSQATEPAVLQQLPNARIIHLATHGTFNEQQPLLGGVALAQTGKESQNDGLLTAEEIVNLNSKGKLTLNAELLVLSACNTGRGRITGDGVIGLSRSFIAAGIPSVIVSLWSVPDAPTAELMTQFYTNLYQKKLDKAQALRQAMLAMMEKHRNNPRAWAAFTLIGEAE